MKKIMLKQSYPEGCLPTCISYILNIENNRELEKIVFLNSFDNQIAFFDYSLFVINLLSKKLNFSARIYVQSKYNEYIRKLKKNAEKRISIKKERILPLKKFKNYEPFVIYIDSKFLGISQNHYSHFVVVDKISTNKMKIFDPWKGELRFIDIKNIEKAINSLMNRLWCAGKMIKIEKI